MTIDGTKLRPLRARFLRPTCPRRTADIPSAVVARWYIWKFDGQDVRAPYAASVVASSALSFERPRGSVGVSIRIVARGILDLRNVWAEKNHPSSARAQF